MIRHFAEYIEIHVCSLFTVFSFALQLEVTMYDRKFITSYYINALISINGFEGGFETMFFENKELVFYFERDYKTELDFLNYGSRFNHICKKRETGGQCHAT